MTEKNKETIKDNMSDDCSEEKVEEKCDSAEETENNDTDKREENDKEPQNENPEEEDMKTKYMRLMADFQNYKRRAENERSNIHAYANEKIVVELLEVMDNFDRALSHDDNEGFKEGIQMIFEQLKNVLNNTGVREIETENVPFDPNVHNAVMMEDCEDVESGNVSAVLQKGYTLNGKVVRPSMVKVAN